MKYRLKNPEIEAEQFTGKRPYPPGVCDCGLMLSGIPGGCQPHVHVGDNIRLDVHVGDWIIKSEDVETYHVLSDATFKKFYEEKK